MYKVLPQFPGRPQSPLPGEDRCDEAKFKRFPAGAAATLCLLILVLLQPSKWLEKYWRANGQWYRPGEMSSRRWRTIRRSLWLNIRKTANRANYIEFNICTLSLSLTACSNSWNIWVSLILGFLSLSFFSCSVSTRGFATIPCIYLGEILKAVRSQPGLGWWRGWRGWCSHRIACCKARRTPLP